MGEDSGRVVSQGAAAAATADPAPRPAPKPGLAAQRPPASFITHWLGAARAQRLARASLVAPIVVSLLVLGLYPLVFTVAASLSRSTLGRPFQSWVGLDNFAQVLGHPDLVQTLPRTVTYALGVSALSTLLGLLMALALYHAARKGAWARALILLPLMVPPVIAGNLWKLIYNPGGGLLTTLLNRLGVDAAGLAPLASISWALPAIALADVWQWSPLVALLVLAALLAQDDAVIDAAQLDGASGWQLFRHITLPAIAGTLATAFFIRLVLAFKVFDLIFITTSGGPGQATTTASYAIYQAALRSFDIGRAAAITLLLAGVVTLITLPLGKLARRLNEHG